ncbi:MAG: GNAT family N-acetyltransferase [Reichenbachiella sp.]
MNSMLVELNSFLKKNNIHSVSIKQSPDCFNEHNTLLHEAMRKLHITIAKEINHHVELSKKADLFSEMQKRRINKCLKSGFKFLNGNSFSDALLYQFLVKCRAQQKLKVNITEQHFSKLIRELDSNFDVHVVTDSFNNLTACLVIIKVTESITYSFLPAFDRNYSQFSPLAFLFHNYFNRAKNSSIEMIDLGISSINGKPQEGLINFKEGIGGIRTDRFSYHWDLQ